MSRRRTEEVLADFVNRHEFKHLLSIGDPDEPPPRGWRRFQGTKIRLTFDDVMISHDGWAPATITDVERIIGFLDKCTGPTLIHCYAGISRSAAAACIFAALKLGPGKEMEAVRHVYKTKPSIFPNKWVLNIADQLMDRDGKLFDAAMHVWPQNLDDVERIVVPTLPRKGAHGS